MNWCTSIDWDFEKAFKIVREKFISRLDGASWKGLS